jgi:hypothetical protein
VVGKRGPRLWRTTRPDLDPEEREHLTAELMSARRSIRTAVNDAELATLRARVAAAKVALGERGTVWWTDGAPDLNRRLVLGTCYAEWWEQLSKR